MVDRALLAYGQFKRKERVELTLVAQEAALGLQFVDTQADAMAWLENREPHALLIDDQGAESEALCLQARAHARQAHTPIISLSRDLDDLSFAEVFNWGGDDAVQLSSMWPLLSRVRSLPRESNAADSGRRGTAIVGDPDKNRRVVRARVLHNAGFSIRFALTASEVAKDAADAGTTLVVLDAELEGAVEALSQSAEQHPGVTHVLLCPPRRIPELWPLFSTPNAVVTDGFAPPENVVFLANELSRGGSNDARTSRRLLYGTRVAFRGEGRDQDDYGYSYNVSAGGLYVRTLAPPVDDRVWIELRPPRCDRWVRLEGEVVWRRPFGPASNATVPPGFGVKLVDATRSNMTNWLSGYREFQRALGAD